MLRRRASIRPPAVAAAVQRRWKHFVPTPTGLSTTMTIVNPFVHREPQLADSLQALPAVPMLLHAIKRYESRPFRIISHECEDGKLFNCAFFDSKADMSAYKAWYTACALTEGGKFHGPLSAAFADQSDMPTPETWLWGSGLEVGKAPAWQIATRLAEFAATHRLPRCSQTVALVSTSWGWPSVTRVWCSGTRLQSKRRSGRP